MTLDEDAVKRLEEILPAKKAIDHTLRFIRQFLETEKKKMLDCTQLTYEQMADAIRDIHKEVSDRNPIGVNMYLPYLKMAIEALDEISKGEVYNPTSSGGPPEKRRREEAAKGSAKKKVKLVEGENTFRIIPDKKKDRDRKGYSSSRTSV